MATGIQLSTAGVRMYYAPETTAGTRPTQMSAYTECTDELKSIPESNPQPENLETTTLAEAYWKTYIQGLRDPGGALQFTMNLTEKSKGEWKSLVTAYETAASAGLRLWFVVIIPGLTEAPYFTGQPSAIALPAFTPSSVLEANVYITTSSGIDWYAIPTTTT